MQSQRRNTEDGGLAIAERFTVTMRRPAFVNVEEVHWGPSLR